MWLLIQNRALCYSILLRAYYTGSRGGMGLNSIFDGGGAGERGIRRDGTMRQPKHCDNKFFTPMFAKHFGIETTETVKRMKNIQFI